MVTQWRLMTRRELLAGSFAAALHPPSPSILVHEHVLVDFIGADRIGPGAPNTKV